MAWTLTVVREGKEQHMGIRRFRVTHVIAPASTKIQGGKTNEQERRPHGCSSDGGKDSYP